VLTEERGKGERREGSYREKRVERSKDLSTNEKCGIWGSRGRTRNIHYSTGNAISEGMNAGGGELPRRERGSGGPSTNRQHRIWKPCAGVRNADYLIEDAVGE
jgi:hypothetical protein